MSYFNLSPLLFLQGEIESIISIMLHNFKKIMQFAICNYISFLKSTVFFELIDLFHYSVHKNIKKYSYQKMNNLRDILYFMTKCARIK